MQQSGLIKLFAVTLAVFTLTACESSGGVKDGEAENQNVATTENTQTQAVPEDPSVGVETTENSAAMSNPLLDQTTIYFGFDRSEIRPEFKEILNAHAEYLKSNTQARIILEGHCDERGTVEYNLALGERRANATKSYLITQGVSTSQIDTVSFGEERPAMVGSSENAWAKNRRSEIKYQAR